MLQAQHIFFGEMFKLVSKEMKLSKFVEQKSDFKKAQLRQS
jgi:hypothetical protein